MRQSLTLNRVLFGSAQRNPDAATRELLARYWPGRARHNGTVQRFLLLAQVRLLAHTGELGQARHALHEMAASVEGVDVESRLLRAWSATLDDAGTGAPLPAPLVRMDPHLALLASGAGPAAALAQD